VIYSGIVVIDSLIIYSIQFSRRLDNTYFIQCRPRSYSKASQTPHYLLCITDGADTATTAIIGNSATNAYLSVTADATLAGQCRTFNYAKLNK